MFFVLINMDNEKIVAVFVERMHLQQYSSKTIKSYKLNYFNNRSTNASAESFNAKIKKKSLHRCYEYRILIV